MNTHPVTIDMPELQNDASQLTRRSPAAWAKAALPITALAATVAILGINLTLATTKGSPAAAQTPIQVQQPREETPWPPTRPIIPASIFDAPEPSYFYGTGDGSAGVWMKP